MKLLYNLMLHAIIFIGWPLLVPYTLLSRKRRDVLLDRLTLTGLPSGEADAETIWIHALSVGETMAALPLVDELNRRYPKTPIAFSVSTRTGFEVGLKTYQNQVNQLFYSPYDLPWSVRRTLKCINPKVVMIVETDIWPNLLFESAKSRIPVIFVNAKLSDRSYAGYSRMDFFFRPLFNHFAKIIVQTTADRNRFEALGVEPQRLAVGGNIKFDQPQISLNDTQRHRWSQTLNITEARRVLIVGSTHPGEEAIISDSFTSLKQRFPDLYLIIAPRDPQRAKSVADLFNQSGLPLSLLSEMEASNRQQTDGVVIDRLGVLRELYAIADIALIGGSLLRIDGIGGHNPLEPAAFAKPVLFGPHATNFRDIYGRLEAAGGALQVAGAVDIKNAVSGLFDAPRRRHAMGRRAYEIFTANQGAAAKTVDLTAPYIENRRLSEA